MENTKTSTKFLLFALLFTTMLLTHSILSLVSISNGQSKLTEVVDAPAASYSGYTTLMHLARGILTISTYLYPCFSGLYSNLNTPVSFYVSFHIVTSPHFIY